MPTGPRPRAGSRVVARACAARASASTALTCWRVVLADEVRDALAAPCAVGRGHAGALAGAWRECVGHSAGIDDTGALRVRCLTVPSSRARRRDRMAPGAAGRMMHETDATSPAVTDIGAFCRAVEAHLCRVNGGHLVRIVGPAFELVAGWAKEGMPLRIVLHGVDRTSHGSPRRGLAVAPCGSSSARPTCVTPTDQWRRAVGVHARRPTQAADAVIGRCRRRRAVAAAVVAEASRARPRATVRDVSATSALPSALSDAVAATIRDVDACLDASRGARREARTAIVERLVTIEHALTQAARSSASGALDAWNCSSRCERELSPYRATDASRLRSAMPRTRSSASSHAAISPCRRCASMADDTFVADAGEAGRRRSIARAARWARRPRERRHSG